MSTPNQNMSSGQPSHPKVKTNGALPGEVGTTASVDEMEQKVSLSEELLLPSPDSLNVSGVQVLVPVVRLPLPLEVFWTHPTLVLTLASVTPEKGAIGAITYVVPPSMFPVLRRNKFEPAVTFYYPVLIDSNPRQTKLVMVKPPAPPRTDWDAYNLAKKLILEQARTRWSSIRTAGSSYEAAYPENPDDIEPAVFPGWTTDDWLDRSVVASDLLIRDESHPIFDKILHRK